MSKLTKIIEELGIKQITKKEAIAIYDSEIWKNMSYKEQFELAFFQEKLCIPFNVLHKATEEVLGRSVWTHEFAFADKLYYEYIGLNEKPTFKDILDLLPKDKLILGIGS